MATSQQPSPTKDYFIPEIIAIWGGGLIGLSTAAYFARKGIRSIIYDIDEAQVSRINAAVFPSYFEDWVGFPVTEYVTHGYIRATRDKSELCLSSSSTHFIAVATERNGEPYMSAIETVLQNIADLSPDLCIIESTVVPGSTETLGRKHGLPLGIATRRDWFTTSDNNLENCVRVYSGVNDVVTKRMQVVLSVVCRKLAQATSCTVVELTKSLDNGIFHATAMYASQVASAYPSANVAEALRLAATHWRLGNHVYFPSLGTGGPCVPLANKYLLNGACRPNKLTIAAAAIRYDSGNPQEVAALVKKQLKPGDRLAILGVCYRGDIRAHVGSPHVKFGCELIRLGVPVGVHDPYYSDSELKGMTGAVPLNFPEDLKEFQFIYVGANHTAYVRNFHSVLPHMRRGQIILDNQGIWEPWAEDAVSLGIVYHRVGGAHWLPTAGLSDQSSAPLSFTDRSEQDDNIVFTTKFFRIRAIPDRRDLSSDPWFVVDRPDSVIVIPISQSGHFLLQNQYRPQSACSSWEFPGGGIDPGESPHQAAERELFEETGLGPSSIHSLGSYHPIPGLSAQRTHVFLAQVTDDQLAEPRSSVPSEGISTFRIVDVPTYRSLAASSEIIDGFTLSAFALWQSLSDHCILHPATSKDIVETEVKSSKVSPLAVVSSCGTRSLISRFKRCFWSAKEAKN